MALGSYGGWWAGPGGWVRDGALLPPWEDVTRKPDPGRQHVAKKSRKKKARKKSKANHGKRPNS
jgi:hypothetical protein